MLRARAWLLTALLTAALVLPLAAQAKQPSVRFGKVDRARGSVTLTVRGAGPTQRVTLPWKLAYDLAWRGKHQGGIKVSTARDGFTGNMLRLVAGSGKQQLIVDRMRRGGPNGQSGASALRMQYGTGGWAFHLGRTVATKQVDERKVIGRSGPSRRGAYVMDPWSLMSRAHAADGKTLQWYFASTRKNTSDPSKPLVPFNPYGTGGKGVTARPVTLVGADALLHE